VSGSSRRRLVARSSRIGWSGAVSPAAVTTAAASPAPLQVAKGGERARVGPLEVVEQQRDGCVLGDNRNERLECVDLGERVWVAERELGAGSGSAPAGAPRRARRPRARREERCAQRNVRKNAARAPSRSPARRERRRGSSRAHRRAASCRPRPRLDLEQSEGAVERPAHAQLEHVELGRPPEQADGGRAGVVRRTQDRAGRSERTSSCRRIADSSARVSAVGSRPSSSSNRRRKPRYVSSASVWRPSV
jgi:hypothetical protein